MLLGAWCLSCKLVMISVCGDLPTVDRRSKACGGRVARRISLPKEDTRHIRSSGPRGPGVRAQSDSECMVLRSLTHTLTLPGRTCWGMGLLARWRGSRLVSLRGFATVTSTPQVPQTVIEKVVQRYAVDWPSAKAVKAGDYVMIRPQHVMTHDNTGPVISK